MSECSTNRFFGPVQTHIKMHQGSFIAVEGPNMTHKMNTLPSMRFPYQQILSSRITLRAGQTNYLLNHLGLGDNATFLAITALYDDKSKFESDNYVQYSYYSDNNRMYSFAQMLVLTGNSENRIEQLYLTNPNQNSAVVLEVMVAVIDEYYDFFTQNENGENIPPIDRFEPIILFSPEITYGNPSGGTGSSMSHTTSIDGDRSFVSIEPLILGGSQSGTQSGTHSGTQSGIINELDISNFIIDDIFDFNGQIVSYDPLTAIIIKDWNGNIISPITSIGPYYIYFNVKDQHGNRVSQDVNVKINVI